MTVQHIEHKLEARVWVRSAKPTLFWPMSRIVCVFLKNTSPRIHMPDKKNRRKFYRASTRKETWLPPVEPSAMNPPRHTPEVPPSTSSKMYTSGGMSIDFSENCIVMVGIFAASQDTCHGVLGAAFKLKPLIIHLYTFPYTLDISSR